MRCLVPALTPSGLRCSDYDARACTVWQHAPSCHVLPRTVSLPTPHARAGAVWQHESGGRICVLGSVQLFDDKYLDKEENNKLMDFVFKWLRPVSVVASV